MTSARVIGAGLSGLSTAWCLADAGFDVDVVEATAAAGGLIGTHRTPEGLVERAANAFVWGETTARWFDELGIEPRFADDRSRRRFIFRNGRPHRWPLGAGESAAMAGRLAMNWARHSLPPRDTESVADWSERVAGAAATRWVVAPALQGIYASPASRLSARAIFGGMFGAGPRGATPAPVARTSATDVSTRRPIKKRGSVAPPGGMGEFIDRLREALDRRGVTFTFGRTVAALDPSIPTAVCTDAVSAARLVAPHAPALAAAIGAVSMTSILTATAFFPARAEDLRGFGILFPRESGVVALGARFNTDIFESRSAIRSETWIYGSADLTTPLPREREVPGCIMRDRQLLTGRTEAPIALYCTRVGDRTGPDPGSPPGLPIYGAEILAVQARLADLPPWLALAGNYLGRLGVAKLLDVSFEAALRLSRAHSGT